MAPGYDHSPFSGRGRRRYCRGNIHGSLRALANASIAIGEESVRITLPIDMKVLRQSYKLDGRYLPRLETRFTNPKVAADPSIYWPNDRITPFAPAPYRMIVTPPLNQQ